MLGDEGLMFLEHRRSMNVKMLLLEDETERKDAPGTLPTGLRFPIHTERPGSLAYAIDAMIF